MRRWRSNALAHGVLLHAALLLLLPSRHSPVDAQGMGMSGMSGGSIGVGLSATGGDPSYMAPPSMATDSHTSSVVLDWNAVVRSLARGVPFGDWAFEDPSAANATSRVGTFVDPPLPPAAAARVAALCNVAMREALAPLLRPGTPGALLGPGWSGVTATDLYDAAAYPGAAAAFAAHYVLSTLLPHRQQSVFDMEAPGFDAVLARQLSSSGYGLGGVWTPPEPMFGMPQSYVGAQRVGTAAGRLVVQIAAADGMDGYAPFAFDATAAAAAVAPWQQYRPTGCGTQALCAAANDTGVRSADSATTVTLPQTATAQPLVAAAAADWAPPALSATSFGAGVPGGAYEAQLAWSSVYGELGSSARSAVDTQAAWFWRGGPNTGGVSGMMTTLAAAMLDSASPGGVSGPDDDSLWDAADVLTRLTVAIWDTTVAASAAKAAAVWWRPETALRVGGHVGWSPELVNPAEADYPSMHAAVCGAAAAVLGQRFGDGVNITLVTEEVAHPAAGGGGRDLATPAGWQYDAAQASGAFNLAHGIGLYAADWLALQLAPRSFASFSAMAADCAQSRRFAGVSLNVSTDAGLALGAALGGWVATSYPGNLTVRAARAAAIIGGMYPVVQSVAGVPLDISR